MASPQDRAKRSFSPLTCEKSLVPGRAAAHAVVAVADHDDGGSGGGRVDG